jgi:uncharacterized protein YndB with AHSA1/START domain
MTKPYSFSVSATIAAPIATVFQAMADLSRLDEWSPFSAMDSSLVSSHSDPASGVGAWYEWTGKRMGKGRMTVTSESVPSQVVFRMEFMNGGGSEAISTYTLTEVEGGTAVAWELAGERGAKDRIIAGLLGLDKMMKKHFANGLGTLKGIIESAT